MLSQLIYRGGTMTGSSNFSFSGILEDDGELLQTFIMQHYKAYTERPHEILIPSCLEDPSALTEILSEDQPRQVRVVMPQKGEKRALVEMALANAESEFRRKKDVAAIREKTLLEMQEKFRLTSFPERIECFDNSNISGTNLVSALVAFTDGVKDTSRYRKYKLKTIDTSDDYGGMREVLMRRYRKAEEENNLPDLVIIDGGKGHLNVALQVFRDLNIISVDLIAVAKEEGRHDKGGTLEQVFLPNIKDPVRLPKNSQILFLLQQIRDEAHRSAITYHRKLRSKKTVRSDLDDVPGIGPAKRKALLKAFGSLKGVKAASDDELLAVKGISKANIASLRRVFG
jgi:excinuclease ABC subunit C